MAASGAAAASAGCWICNPVLANFRDRLAASVPGWKATQVACGWVRRNSTAAVRTIRFSAAFAARQEISAPSRLSLMLPT